MGPELLVPKNQPTKVASNKVAIITKPVINYRKIDINLLWLFTIINIFKQLELMGKILYSFTFSLWVGQIIS